jgi:hypothetical protein
MKTLLADYSLHELCAALDVTRSGYQTWAQRVPGQRAQADAQLLPLLRQGHAEGRGNYGRPRLLAWLAQRGIRCGHTRAVAVAAPRRLESKAAAVVPPREFDRQ